LRQFGDLFELNVKHRCQKVKGPNTSICDDFNPVRLRRREY